jgi:hypothetical protein
LKVDPQTQKDRLLRSRKGSLLDFDENELIIWGGWLEQEAKKTNVTFIDAKLSPKAIFNMIGEK